MSLWVISRHFAVQSPCPLYPRKQTLIQYAMSALGHKRTFAIFDHLIGAKQDGLGHFKAERLGGLAIEDELKFRCPLNRKIGGIGAFENPVHEVGRMTKNAKMSTP